MGMATPAMVGRRPLDPHLSPGFQPGFTVLRKAGGLRESEGQAGRVIRARRFSLVIPLLPTPYTLLPMVSLKSRPGESQSARRSAG